MIRASRVLRSPAAYSPIAVVVIASLGALLLAGCSSDDSGSPPACSLTVTAPNGGELLTVGTTTNITWNKNEGCGGSVKIELLLEDEACLTIAESTTNDGSHPWTVVHCSRKFGDYKIRVTDPANSLSDESDDSFKIAGQGTGAYYVATDGSDDNPGSIEEPWRTVHHAVNSIHPGSTVYICTGTYEEEVIMSVSGTTVEMIHITSAPGEEATVQSLEFAKGTAYVEVSDLTIEGYSVWGVFIRGENHHIYLTDLDITGGEAGIRITLGASGDIPMEGAVSDVFVRDCTVRSTEYTAVDCTPGPGDRMEFQRLEISGAGMVGEASYGADGIAVEKGEDILVEDCYIHDNGGDGIDLNSRDTAGNVSGIIVRRNRVVRNHRNGIKMWAGGRMENNMVWGSGDSPVWLGTYPCDLEVVNNTIAYNMWDEDYSDRNYSLVVAYPEAGPSAAVDLTLVNNIFAFNSSDAMGGPTGLYLGEGVNLVLERNNLYWSREDGEIVAEFVTGDTEFTRAEITDGTWAAATGQGTDDLTEDPLFTSGWPFANLHLQPGSPAVDAGTATEAPIEDLEGNLRPQSSGYDMGAYER